MGLPGGFIVTTYLGIKVSPDNDDGMFINLLVGAILLIADVNVPRDALLSGSATPVSGQP